MAPTPATNQPSPSKEQLKARVSALQEQAKHDNELIAAMSIEKEQQANHVMQLMKNARKRKWQAVANTREVRRMRSIQDALLAAAPPLQDAHTSIRMNARTP